ncbi:hypothetical protein HG530_006684 [Fusarium avenaceum]|nr:hypothetical protein HG530_006684 [Fusarium avenaceum]
MPVVPTNSCETIVGAVCYIAVLDTSGHATVSSAHEPTSPVGRKPSLKGDVRRRASLDKHSHATDLDINDLALWGTCWVVVGESDVASGCDVLREPNGGVGQLQRRLERSALCGKVIFCTDSQS